MVLLLIYHRSGPIASSFTNRYGCRVVTIAGALLGALGLAVSTLAKSITVLYFTIGVCTGNFCLHTEELGKTLENEINGFLGPKFV